MRSCPSQLVSWPWQLRSCPSQLVSLRLLSSGVLVSLQLHLVALIVCLELCLQRLFLCCWNLGPFGAQFLSSFAHRQRRDIRACSLLLCPSHECCRWSGWPLWITLPCIELATGLVLVKLSPVDGGVSCCSLLERLLVCCRGTLPGCSNLTH